MQSVLSRWNLVAWKYRWKHASAWFFASRELGPRGVGSSGLGPKTIGSKYLNPLDLVN